MKYFLPPLYVSSCVFLRMFSPANFVNVSRGHLQPQRDENMRAQEKPDQTQSQNRLEGVGRSHESQITSHGSLPLAHRSQQKTKGEEKVRIRPGSASRATNGSRGTSLKLPLSESQEHEGEEKALAPGSLRADG
jgi:hypothetical protein